MQGKLFLLINFSSLPVPVDTIYYFLFTSKELWLFSEASAFCLSYANGRKRLCELYLIVYVRENCKTLMTLYLRIRCPTKMKAFFHLLGMWCMYEKTITNAEKIAKYSLNTAF